jgi:GNAT superfamily N-acetyltransferase
LSFTLRKARPDDARAVSNLLRMSYATLLAPDYEPGLLAKLLPKIGRANPVLLASGRYYVVEHDDGGMLACGGWSPELPGTRTIAQAEAHVRHFGTHPSAVRMGAGRTILAHCIHEARGAGNSVLHCYSTRTAVLFYASLGFRPLRDILVPIPSTPGMPSVLMRLDLH